MGFEAQAHVYGPIFVFFLKRANDRSLAFFKKKYTKHHCDDWKIMSVTFLPKNPVF